MMHAAGTKKQHFLECRWHASSQRVPVDKLESFWRVQASMQLAKKGRVQAIVVHWCNLSTLCSPLEQYLLDIL